MMRCWSHFLAVGACLSFSCVISCTQNVGSSELPAAASASQHANDEPAPSQAEAKGVVIAAFVTHDSRVSILSSQSSSSRDLRVVVRTNDGVMVADGVSVDELRATDPLLHAIVTTALAKNSSPGTYLDASR